MRELFTLFFVAVLGSSTLVLSGCNETPKLQESGKPGWVLNPNYNGKHGAVGVAGRTYDQRFSTQRRLAITRALDELALQQGVKVELSMKKEEHLHNQSASTSIESKSNYRTTNGSAITAHIEDIWQDPYTGDLYVWLVLD